MFKIAIVVFRECLEIALLLGIIMAATKPIANSRTYIIFGLLSGTVFASIFAILTKYITKCFEGLGDELFDAGIILLTSFIISWTVVWMQGYTKKIRKNLSKLSESIKAGSASQFMLVVVVAMTVLREGAEIILFVYSISSVGNIESSQYIIGIVSGAFSGLTVGTVLYLGLIKYAGRYIFKISTILLTLIAAGLASEAAGILTSTGVIGLYSAQIWDTSWLVENSSIPGKVMNIIVGYDSKPNGMQIIFYFFSIIITASMIKIRKLFNHQVINH